MLSSNSINFIFKPYWDKALKIVKKDVGVTGGHVFPSYNESHIVDVEPIKFDNQEAVIDYLLDRDKNIEDIIERQDCKYDNEIMSYITNLPEFVYIKKKRRNEKIDKITNADNHTSS